MDEALEFQDWEILHGSDSDHANPSVSSHKLSELEGIEGDSEGMVRSDYFSLDSHGKYERPVDVSEEGSVESDNPSWIDPASETRYGGKNSGEFWSDSGSDRSDERKFVDFDAKKELGSGEIGRIKMGLEGEVENFPKSWSDEGKFSASDVKNELGLVETEKSQVGLGGEGENFGKFCSDGGKFSDSDVQTELGLVETGKSQVGFEGIGETRCESEKPGEFAFDISDEGKFSDFDAEKELPVMESGKAGGESQNVGIFWSDSGGIGSMDHPFEKVEVENEKGAGTEEEIQHVSDISCESDGRNELEVELKGDDNEIVTGNVGAIKEVKSSDDDVMKRRVVWWKVPWELLRYCVFRVTPVTSLSLVAAILGIVILGRRLYRMKRKSRSLQLKVTVDDKRVSQFVSRAARLNEAFSVVKRVPIVRPALSAAGVTPWPVMSLR